MDNGKVLIAGGVPEQPSDQAWLYDLRRHRWQRIAPMPEPRTEHISAVLRDGRVLLCGGNVTRGATATCVIYDPRRAGWQPAASLTKPRVRALATNLSDGRVVVAGGTLFEGRFPNEDVEVYDPSSARWQALSALADPVSDPHLVALPSGRLLAIGGFHGQFPSQDTQLYDPASGGWMAKSGNAPIASTVTLLADGRVAAFAGDNSATYDVDSDLWLPMSVPPSALGAPITLRLSDGRVLALGQHFFGDPQATTATWDPSGFPALPGSTGRYSSGALAVLLGSIDALLLAVLLAGLLLSRARIR
jgi:hypothetical protein